MARYGWGRKKDAPAPPPFTEEYDTAPVDPYGVAKVAAEYTLRTLARAHGFETVVIVPHNVVGERQNYSDPYRNVAAIMSARMLAGKQPIIYGDGQQRRCFSYVDDVTGPMVAAGFAAGISGETFNVGPDEDFVTVSELAGCLAEIIGFSPLLPEYVEDRPLEVKAAWCSSDKARRLLGYRTAVDTTGALCRLVDWIKSKGPRPMHYNIPLEIPSDRAPRTWRERLI
jgi:UDP-glucose 4-epimerase